MKAELQRFDGQEGLQRLAPVASIEVSDQTSFRAHVIGAGLSPTVYVDDISMSPLLGLRLLGTPRLPRFVFLLMLVAGRARVIGPDRTIDVRPGDAVVVDTSTPVRFESAEPVRLLRLVTSLEDLPPRIRSGSPLPLGALRRSALVNGLRVFLQSVLSDLRCEVVLLPHLARALQDLLVGAMEEAGDAQLLGAPGPEGIRVRIKQVVEERFGEPSLSPAVIAAELGVSVRYVHRAFEQEDETVSRYIERRRLRAVASQVGSGSSRIRLVELASRYGFTGPAQLGRAFRRRYGVPIEEYRKHSSRYQV